MGKKLAIGVAGLALWYIMNSAPSNPVPSSVRYPLPDHIDVVKAEYVNNQGNQVEIESKNGSLETIVLKTKDIDFDEDFKLETKRYRLVKDDDWLPSRLVGHTAAMFTRLFFWDWDAGWGLDEEKSKTVLSMLESKEELKGLTVRINHNEGFYDWYRMNTQNDLTERNPFLYRWTVGSLVSFKDEIFAEFARGDYYNPLTKTVVLYSNIESVSAHEFGHHADFERFDTDWVYDISRILPPVMLYQEWQASKTYATKIMSEEDGWQFNRYLIPAFGTYCLATLGATRRFLFGKKEDKE